MIFWASISAQWMTFLDGDNRTVRADHRTRADLIGDFLHRMIARPVACDDFRGCRRLGGFDYSFRYGFIRSQRRLIEIDGDTFEFHQKQSPFFLQFIMFPDPGQAGGQKGNML